MTGRPTTTASRWLTRATVGAAFAAFSVVFFACSDDEILTMGYGVSDDSGSSNFGGPDGAETDASATLTSYCPSNKCPEGFTNCPNSRFPCDVDLTTDRNNCGSCGVRCPRDTFRESYECMEGRCVLQCSIHPLALDCDGVSDNGCEIEPISNDHCGACGKKCEDPAKPCVQRGLVEDFDCGCKGDDLYCEWPWPRCVNGDVDDYNCGACDRACDPSGGGATAYENAYYGCIGATCDHLKCSPGWGNCDDKMANGCETDVLTAEHCGSCGNACAPGQECRVNLMGAPECMCPAAETFCPAFCFDGVCRGECFNLATSREHCGSCGLSCTAREGANSTGICTFGTCNLQCRGGWADCNGNESDDCEVNTNSDPRNCGACRKLCDAVAGQACVGGECVVAPCEQVLSDGGIPR